MEITNDLYNEIYNLAHNGYMSYLKKNKLSFSDDYVYDTIMDITAKGLKDVKKLTQAEWDSIKHKSSWIWYRMAAVVFDKRRVFNDSVKSFTDSGLDSNGQYTNHEDD